MLTVNFSESALKILRHLWDKGAGQREYEYPTELAKLFNDPKDCEDAEAELSAAGLIDLGAAKPQDVGVAPSQEIPLKNRIRPAALTLEGERYIAANKL
jgi:hypothetical protein